MLPGQKALQWRFRWPRDIGSALRRRREALISPRDQTDKGLSLLVTDGTPKTPHAVKMNPVSVRVVRRVSRLQNDANAGRNLWSEEEVCELIHLAIESGDYRGTLFHDIAETRAQRLLNFSIRGAPKAGTDHDGKDEENRAIGFHDWANV